MKKKFAITFILTILISACGSSISTTAPTASESALTVTQVPAASTATEIPPIPPTITPTPTLSLPVSQLTPVPSSNTKISAENVQNLQEIAKYYGEINYIAKLTKDNKFLFILDPDGLTKYDYASMEILTHVAVANSVSDLQISNDGNLLMLDKQWLLDLKNDKESKLHVLSEKIHLLNFYSRDFALSPDGKVIAVEQNNCKNLCEHIFRLVSTEDFSELFTSSAQTLQNLPTFSSDGKYFALADLTQVATSGGGTQVAGGTVGIWTTSNFTKVSSFSVNFPFDVTGISFSEDNNLLVIAQRNSIDIIDVLSGDSKATIADLCDSYQRRVMFVPPTTDKVLEHSDCSSGEWTISGSTARLSNDDVPDLSRIAFDENRNFKTIPYVYPITSNLRAYRDQYYLKFLNNDILGFKNFDLKTLDRHSCDVSLVNGSLDCQSHAPEYNNGRYLGKDVILATDGKYYGYTVGNDRVDIYSIEKPTQVYYSIPFRQYIFDLIALDPVNKLVIYNLALSMSQNRVVIQDMENDRILEKWEGETFISSIAFSENDKFATFCRATSYSGGINKDKLAILDLSTKKITNTLDFTCRDTALSLSNDGSKLSVEHYIVDPIDQLYSTRVMILNTISPFEKYHSTLGGIFSHAIAFSPDDSMIAVTCSIVEICFLDTSELREIHRFTAHSGITNLAFSPDGSLLATSSNWGLISLWAVPPFTSDSRQPQSSPLSSYIPSFSWDFNQDGWFEGWGEQDWQSAGLKDLKVKDGYLSASSTVPDTELYSNEGFGIDSSKFPQIKIRMRVSDGNSAVIYFTHGPGDWAEDQGKYFDIIADNEFHTYTINMSEVASWKGIIDQLRLDLRNANGAAIDIDYIHLLPLLPTSFSWNFDEAGNLEGWGEQDWQSSGLKDLKVESGYLSATVTSSAPFLHTNAGLDIDIDANKFSRIEIRMRVSAGESAQVFFTYGDGDWTEDKGKSFSIIAGTEFNTYIIDLSNVPTWKGIIGELRLDPVYDFPSTTIEIDYIRLLP